MTALGKRGDVATARTVAAETLAAVGEGGPYNADVLAALGGAEKKAGHAAEALAAFERANAAAERNGAAPGVRVERELDLAEAYAATGRRAEAKKAWAAALATGGGALDVGLATRAARAALALKDSGEALKQARRAVALSQGEDAAAQAALAQALGATGDTRRRGRRVEEGRRARAAERRLPRGRRRGRQEEDREGFLSRPPAAHALARGDPPLAGRTRARHGVRRGLPRSAPDRRRAAPASSRLSSTTGTPPSPPAS